MPPKLPWPASFTQQICRWISPLSYMAVSKHGLCAIVQGMVPLLSLLFWEPKGSCGVPFPFRQHRCWFLELHLPGRAAHQLSCLCWAQPSSLQAGWGASMPSLPSATPSQTLSPISIWWVWTGFRKRIQPAGAEQNLRVLSERDWDCTSPPLLSVCWGSQECSTETSDSPFPFLWD